MIKVKCPNEECDASFTVKEEYAGKKARCPKCKAVINIPATDEDDIPDAEETEEPEERIRPGREASDSVTERPSRKKRRDDDGDDEEPSSRRRSRDDDDGYEDDDRPKKKRSRADDRDDDDDEDDRPKKKRSRDDDDDEDDENDRPRRKKLRKRPPDVKSAVLVGGAMLGFILSGISPVLPAFFVHASAGGQSFSAALGYLTEIFEGYIIIIFSVLLLIGFSSVMTFLFVLKKSVSDRIVTIAASVGLGVGLLYFVWMLSLWWIYFRILSYAGKGGGSIYPWFGTFMPMLAGLGVAGCCAALLVMRRENFWLGPAAGGGLLLGLIFFAADGQPWADPPFLGGQAKSHSNVGGGLFGP
jgi:hypothetical protein